ncbi:helix-turn-helix transcriptional regulator [Streptomyces iranensis]|uniref:Helix-turn-helix domain protein n=1 Tax=Streptomyces iranensis TaxID=576784 RepID=A0A061A4Y0_9ACTN|nr:helix-turn-helix transcriptional regulator [Streptomyces iranensis]MBP2063526.1 transcriptional regulator with XRE-family HTH domain [Streptomyces iranensis]CDR17895.1 helix-turn-helix domain protein [Streptomyces iranensis]
MSRIELADFLRRRREALRPDQVPVTVTHPPGRRARRTPGLRREEVAALAGVSISYYERLEQARAPRPSPQVLAAIGTALQLTAAEREYLARLAGQVPPGTGTDRAPVSAGARRLLDRLGPIPAYLVDERQDIVAWNGAAAALITDFGVLSAEERNTVRLSIRLNGVLCTAPADAEGEFARQTAAQLRWAGARYPAERVLGELADEFAAHSADFVAAWRSHDVRPIPTLRKHLRHPTLGELDLECQTLLLPDTDVRLVIYTAEPDSPSAAALARLDTRDARPHLTGGGRGQAAPTTPYASQNTERGS